MLPKVAAITMVYNEAVFLPIWARHYARQVGADHCYVVDHGSTDPIVVPPGVNVIRIPRSAHDDVLRAAFISDLAGSLLRYYQWVSYTDVDELLLADPRSFRHLPEFCETAGALPAVSAVGLDVQHVPALEPALEFGRPIGPQREWVRFTSAMCKPALTQQPVTWSAGFHCCDHPLRFGTLFLFHLHWADASFGLQRLQKTRDMAWAGDGFGNHQRVTDAQWLALFQGMADLPRRTGVDLDPSGPPARDWLERTARSVRAGPPCSIDLGINAGELWQIPAHFRARL